VSLRHSCGRPLCTIAAWTFRRSQLALLVLVGCGEREPRGMPPSRPQEIAGLAELVTAAPIIIVGRVVRITQGRIAGPPEEPLQFQDVLVAVERYLKGGPKPDTLVLEQVDPRGRVLLDFEPYRRKQRLVLFLRPGEGGHHVVFGHGRYRIDGDAVRATKPGILADKIDGMLLEQFRSLIQATLRPRARSREPNQ
jgi:hypothetical protein